MPLREQADGGVPLVIEDAGDPASRAILHVARGILALAPASSPEGEQAPGELPILPLVASSPQGEVAPAAPVESAKPVGMSLPMA
jgi:ATP-binding protein involved in chromosome partitioning